MLLAADAQHFAGPPGWTWYILFYFFLAGIAGGSYVIASLMRLRGEPADEPAARVGYYAAFAALIPCPVLLILDLGKPARFWHMLWNTTPNDAGLNFKIASPMSVGAWGLLIFGAFATVSFVDALVRDGRARPLSFVARILGGALGKIFAAVGALLGLFIAGYTGVLLAVSNQPVWSDTWALGGLFLASGMSAAAALLLFLIRYRAGAAPSAGPLTVSERLYAVLELILIVIFVLTLIPAGTLNLAFAFPWLILWLVAFVALIPSIAGLLTGRAVTPEGVTVAVHTTSAARVAATSALVLIGVLALRAAVIFSAQ